jgi:glutamyl-tRNA synthetase
MTVIVRFAPSPTGFLHIGNVRTALLNWLFARRAGGRFLLRLDDTDVARSTEAFATAIQEDLTWLGLTWDGFFRQSDRTARYVAVADRLKASGRLYPCYETEEELDRRRKLQQARGLPPIYDRAALTLTAEAKRDLAAKGLIPHWRFKLDNSGADGRVRPSPVTWDDLVRGPQSVDAGSLSDPVLIRGDGTFLYTFTSVVDDIETDITHVVRGEDHVTNTGVQIQIFEALGARVPAFAHFSLLVDKDGSALSKRLGSLSVRGLREAGLEAMAVVAHAALIGTSDPVVPHHGLGSLVDGFAFSKLSRSPSRFDMAELEGLNAKLLHTTPWTAVAPRLQAQGVQEATWDAVRGNVQRLDDAVVWQTVIEGPVSALIEDAPFIARAAALLPETPWDTTTWGAWTSALKAATGVKGRALFHPLRLALTGRETGPEMAALLPLIGRERALQRLAARS